MTSSCNSTGSSKSSVQGDRPQCQWRLFVSRGSPRSSRPAWWHKKHDHELLDVNNTITEDSSCSSIVEEYEPETQARVRSCLASSNDRPQEDYRTATMKTVKFHKRVLVKPAIHICNYTDDEIESTWHDHEDIQRFQNEARLEKRSSSGAQSAWSDDERDSTSRNVL